MSKLVKFFTITERITHTGKKITKISKNVPKRLAIIPRGCSKLITKSNKIKKDIPEVKITNALFIVLTSTERETLISIKTPSAVRW